ncbi:MAG TPA: hypothetical protein DIC22_05585 [Chitinophagaceae bacterium]|nr:hypothetical protein [Chitinophagaceae bacterium]
MTNGHQVETLFDWQMIKKNSANIVLAIWRGDGYMPNFLFAFRLQPYPVNNARWQFLSSSFVTLFSSNYGLTIFK